MSWQSLMHAWRNELIMISDHTNRGIRSSICQQYPWLEESGVIDVLIPKKEPVLLAKLGIDVSVAIIGGQALFFQAPFLDLWFPSLRVQHQYPEMMPKLRCDKGAIKFVLSGAMIMAPGLTSPGATIHTEVEKDVAVAVYAEGIEPAMAIGVTKMSTQEMRDVNKGIAVDNLTYLADGLWKNPVVG